MEAHCHEVMSAFAEITGCDEENGTWLDELVDL